MSVADRKLLHPEGCKAFPHEEEDLQVCRCGIRAHDVEVDLHELPVTPALGVLSAPDFRRVPAPEGQPDLGEVCRHESGKRDGEIEPQGHVAAAVVQEAIDLLVRFPPSLAEEDFGELQDGGVDGQEPEPFEHVLQLAHEPQAVRFLVREKVPESLRDARFDELVVVHDAK